MNRDIPYTKKEIGDRGEFYCVQYLLKNGYENGRINKDELDAPVEMVLQNLNLVNEEGKLKNAALLLFAKKPQRYFTCVQFKIGRFGHSEADLIIQDVIEGNIIQMADRVMEVLKSKYLTMPIRFEGMRRIEKLEIPEEALREILYNAIAHKDYMGAPIQMRVWDNYIEVWNEGELPAGYTPEILLERHSSRPRNRNIANAFFKAGFVDAWGRGYKKIREGFESAGLPMPVIESADGGVRVTFQRNNANGSQTGSQTSSQTGSQTPSNQILKMISDNPKVTRKQMSSELGISDRMVAKYLKKLQDNGIVRREGGKFGGEWVIIDTEDL